jgi:hypothetical protein
LLLKRRGQGTARTLKHQIPAADGTFPVLSLAATDLFSASIAESVASAITDPLVVGAREMYEITIPLQPAWDPAKLAVPADGVVVPAGLEDRYPSSAYVENYCGGGIGDIYLDVGRLWDANTDGRWSCAPYNATLPDVADLVGDVDGPWPRMPYEARDCLTAVAVTTGTHRDALGRLLPDVAAPTRGAYLEWTPDGTTWYTLAGESWQIVPGRLAVRLTVRNLTGIYPAEATRHTTNLFRLLADPATRANVKLRLTCTIEGPDRSRAYPDRRATAGTRFTQAAYFDRSDMGGYRKVASGSRFMGGGAANEDNAAQGKLDAIATALQDQHEDRQIEAVLPIEWPDHTLNLTDVITRIEGIEYPLGINSGQALRYPRVVGITRQLTAETWMMAVSLDTDRRDYRGMARPGQEMKQERKGGWVY